ncbi:MAG: HlyC/CorC family transporter [Geminicoccaceae bacterium]|nr:HlyC/CorC family transporter [Geminicoccaceae bacterium]MCB9944300.1 HlyC/CorC family transporter [Geminicoccaceae bacterium]
MLWSILWIVLLLAANAFFVAAEFALVRVRDYRINQMAETGHVRARMTLNVIRHMEAYLAACQLGITMASLGLGWVGEPAVAALLEPVLHFAGLSDAALHSLSFLLGFLIFSSLHIVIGEQVPKTLAIREAEATSLWTVYPLQAFFILCYPLNWLLNRSSRAILSALGVAEAGHAEVYTGDELRSLIGQSHLHGAMRKHEHDMLGGILDLSKVEVSEIMTHRKNMVTIDGDRPFGEIVALVRESSFTRFPLWRGDHDTVIGTLHAKDMLSLALEPDGPDRRSIDEIASPPWFIPETTTLQAQLMAFRQRREHLAIVVDEYGDIQGLVTLEDILEEIVGEIADEKDIEVPGIKIQTDGSVLVEGKVTVRDLNRQLSWNLSDDEASTVAGLVIHLAERIPEVGQSFDFDGLRFDVLRRTGHQLSLLRIRRIARAEHVDQP